MTSSPPKRRYHWAQLKAGLPVLQTGLRPESLVAEDYRKIAVQIEESMMGASNDHQILAITSPEPMAGKTLTSLNLALVLARRGERRVLLLEADLWRPSLRRYVNIDPDLKGLSELLWSGCSASDVTSSVWGVGLDIITSGQTGEASDFVTGNRLERLGSELRANYDLVIVDCPPLLISGGRSVVNWTDKTIVLVKAGKTKRRSIEESLEIVGPEKTLGIVLNDVKLREGTPYYYLDYAADSGNRVEKDRADYPTNTLGRLPKDR